VTYTKDIALHDKISVDGSDMSNAFSAIALALTDAQVDASGFSVSGFDETLQGNRAAGITATIFYTPESHAILYPLYRDRVVFEIVWQPDGLIDATREVWHGMVKLYGYPPDATRGNVRTMQVTFTGADANGIVADAAT
jgi:hypothetical protein